MFSHHHWLNLQGNNYAIYPKTMLIQINHEGGEN